MNYGQQDIWGDSKRTDSCSSIYLYVCMYVYHQATVVFILDLPFLCKEHSRKEEADYKVGPTLSTHGGDVGNISRAQAEERWQSRGPLPQSTLEGPSQWSISRTLPVTTEFRSLRYFLSKHIK